jgi:integrase
MPRQKKQVLKKRKDGRFACRYKDMWFYGSTSDEALKAREEYKRSEEKGFSRSNAPVLEYAAQWLELYRPNVKRHTFNAYQCSLENVLDPIKNRPISSITVDDMAQCISGLSNYSRDEITRCVSLARDVFDSAVENGLLKTNPARSKSIRIPKGKEKIGHRAIEDWERKLIIETPHKMRAFFMVMLYAGLRPGEALAINVKRDVDFENKVIHVREAIDLLSADTPTISPGKNENAIRDVPLLPVLEETLKSIPGLIISSDDGEHINFREYVNLKKMYTIHLTHVANHVKHSPRIKPKDWKTITFTPYDMRHSFCTMCRDVGIDIKILMLWMGHSDYGIIMKIYDHITQNRIDTASRILTSSIGKNGEINALS